MTVHLTDEMVERALAAEYGAVSLLDVGDPYYKDIRSDIVRAALDAALNGVCANDAEEQR